jgi:hypothetical protein
MDIIYQSVLINASFEARDIMRFMRILRKIISAIKD